VGGADEGDQFAEFDAELAAIQDAMAGAQAVDINDDVEVEMPDNRRGKNWLLWLYQRKWRFTRSQLRDLKDTLKKISDRGPANRAGSIGKALLNWKPMGLSDEGV